MRGISYHTVWELPRLRVSSSDEIWVNEEDVRTDDETWDAEAAQLDALTQTAGQILEFGFGQEFREEDWEVSYFPQALGLAGFFKVSRSNKAKNAKKEGAQDVND